MRVSRQTFTLLELLIVTGVIGILAAMLMPVLASSRAEAKITVCANTERQMAQAIMLYANDNSDYYPYRPSRTHWSQGYANTLSTTTVPGFDERPMLSQYLSDDSYCPFLEKAPVFSAVADVVRMNYNLWFGGPIGSAADIPMLVVGEKAEYNGQSYNILISERDILYRGISSQSNHLGNRNAPVLVQTNTSREVDSYYTTEAFGTEDRGVVDLNYARDDGSVFRVSRVETEDGRLTKVPYKYDNGGQPLSDRWTQLPTASY